jgi:tape measure domain-containing protein
MPIKAAQLIVEIAADISKLTKGASEANGVLGKVGKSLAIAGAGMTAAITLPAIGAGIGMLKVAMGMEQSQIAFTTMLKSGEKATAFLKDLREFAKATPFEFTELQDASRRLLAMGFAAEKILPMMTNIGDAVSGLGLGAEGVDRVTLALGQMQAKSKVSGQEMMQLTEAGIPAWKYLAEAMGKSTSEVMKMSEQGLIPAGAAIDALLAGMNKDFGGMMAAQAKTAAGQLSNLKDAIVELAADMGASLLPIAKELIAKAQEGVQYFNDLTDAGKKNVLMWIGIAAAAGPVITGLGGIVTGLGAVKKAMIAMQLSTAGAIGVMAGLAVAVAAVAVAYTVFQERQAKNAAKEDKIAATAKSYEEYRKQVDALAASQGLQINASGQLVQTIAYQGFVTEKLIQDNFALTEQMWITIQNQQGLNDMVSQGIPYFGFLGDAIMYTNDSLVTLGNGMGISNQAFEAMVTSASNAKASLGGMVTDIKNIQTSMSNWVTNEASSVQNMLGQKLPESSAAYRKGLEAIDEIMGTQYTKAFDLEQKTNALLNQYARTRDVDAFKEGLRKIKEEGLAGMEEQLKTVTEKAQALYDKLLALPTEIQIKIGFTVEDLPAWIDRTVVSSSSQSLRKGTGVTSFAKALGGPVYSGLPYLVGEHGPELFRPSTAGTIIPNQQTSTRSMQVTVFNQGGEPMTEDGLGRAIAQWEWAYGV